MLLPGFAAPRDFPKTPAGAFSPGLPAIRQIELVISTGIDDRNAIPLPDALKLPGGIRLMHMPVEHGRRPVLTQKRFKAFETPVGGIRLITQAGNR